MKKGLEMIVSDLKSSNKKTCTMDLIAQMISLFDMIVISIEKILGKLKTNFVYFYLKKRRLWLYKQTSITILKL